MIFGSSVLGSVASAQLILRVDASQTSNPTPDGSSWVDAYPTLTEALNVAWAGLATSDPADDVTEIWVAQGTYKPTTSTTDRTATFRLAPKAFLYGGFAGGPSGETERSARAGLFNQTILSGDIDGDPRNQLVDSYHVVTADTAGPYRLDGFQVMFGAANHPTDVTDQRGGGMLIKDVDGTFEGSPSSIIVTNTRFQACHAATFGGGLFAWDSDLVGVSRSTFNGCVAFATTFDGEFPQGTGGGLSALDVRRLFVYNSSFVGNRAVHGGGVGLFPRAGGLAEPSGGGLFDSLQTRFVNCLVADNTAVAGGGVVVFGGTSANQKVAVFDHCTVASNVATGLGDDPPVGRHTGGGGFHVNRLARLDLRGSIVWANTDQSSPGTDADSIGSAGPWPVNTLLVTYSDVQRPGTTPWTGAGNILQNPLFVNAAGGNYRLQSNSPCIDQGDDMVFHTLVSAGSPWGPGTGTDPWSRSLGDVVDLDEDNIFFTEFAPFDLDLAAREFDGPPTNGPRSWAATSARPSRTKIRRSRRLV